MYVYIHQHVDAKTIYTSKTISKYLKAARPRNGPRGNGIRVLLLDSTQGANHKIHSLHHDVVPLAAKGMRAGRQPDVESRVETQLSHPKPNLFGVGAMPFGRI